jgi:hypothetical protein
MTAMTSKVLRPCLVFVAVLVVQASAYAQQAVISGTVVDDGAKPVAGATVTVTQVDSGNSIVAVTDVTGNYRVPVQVGALQLAFSAPGFATVRRTGVELLVGQQGLVNVQLTASSESRVVTVSGEVQIQTSFGSSNLDARQTEDIPVNGRVATDLAKTAVGNTQTASAAAPPCS